MHMKLINLLVLLTLGLCCVSQCSCTQRKVERSSLAINTFDSIPDEIDGGMCAFYKSLKDKEKSKYLLINDMGEYAFICIDGTVQKMHLESYSENEYRYKNELYSMTVTIESEIKGTSENSFFKGHIWVQDTSEHKTSTSFISLCSI